MSTRPIIDQEDILENFLTQEKNRFAPVELYSRTAEGCAKQLFVHLVRSEIRVVDDATYKELTHLYNQARTWKKAIEDTRKRLTEPYRTKTSEINEKAKEISAILDNFIEDANKKTCSYLHLLEEQRKQREDAVKAKAAILDLEDEVAPIHSVAPSGNGATIITRKTTKFRVVDEEKIPRQYLSVNEDAVQQALKLGVLEIPGIEIYEETTTSLRKTS